MPSSAHNLRPDCSAIHSAETSDQPKEWLLHPTGITYEFDAKLKTSKRNNPFADSDIAKKQKSKN